MCALPERSCDQKCWLGHACAFYFASRNVSSVLKSFDGWLFSYLAYCALNCENWGRKFHLGLCSLSKKLVREQELTMLLICSGRTGNGSDELVTRATMNRNKDSSFDVYTSHSKKFIFNHIAWLFLKIPVSILKHPGVLIHIFLSFRGFYGLFC